MQPKIDPANAAMPPITLKITIANSELMMVSSFDLLQYTSLLEVAVKVTTTERNLTVRYQYEEKVSLKVHGNGDCKFVHKVMSVLIYK